MEVFKSFYILSKINFKIKKKCIQTYMLVIQNYKYSINKNKNDKISFLLLIKNSFYN